MLLRAGASSCSSKMLRKSQRPFKQLTTHLVIKLGMTYYMVLTKHPLMLEEMGEGRSGLFVASVHHTPTHLVGIAQAPMKWGPLACSGASASCESGASSSQLLPSTLYPTSGRVAPAISPRGHFQGTFTIRATQMNGAFLLNQMLNKITSSDLSLRRIFSTTSKILSLLITTASKRAFRPYKLIKERQQQQQQVSVYLNIDFWFCIN